MFMNFHAPKKISNTRLSHPKCKLVKIFGHSGRTWKSDIAWSLSGIFKFPIIFKFDM